MLLYDMIMGYHQLSVSKEESQEKLAFQGPEMIKWTYKVMPFGPTNGPATFITMVHDMDSMWKETATLVGLTVGENVKALQYKECQLHIAKAYCLTLNLKKSFFFQEIQICGH
jgi:hypothetical protein